MGEIIAVFLIIIISVVGTLFWIIWGFSINKQEQEKYKHQLFLQAIMRTPRWKSFEDVQNTYIDILLPLTIREYKFTDSKLEFGLLIRQIAKDYNLSEQYLNDIEQQRLSIYKKYSDDIKDAVIRHTYDDNYEKDQYYKNEFNNLVNNHLIKNHSLYIQIIINNEYRIFSTEEIVQAIRQNEKSDSIKASLNIDQPDYRSKIDHVSQDDLYKHEFEKQQRDKMSPSLRYSILKRDNYRCRICGRSAVDGVQLEVDHIIPVSKGGESIESNLQTLCQECNRGKSNSMDEK